MSDAALADAAQADASFTPVTVHVPPRVVQASPAPPTASAANCIIADPEGAPAGALPLKAASCATFSASVICERSDATRAGTGCDASRKSIAASAITTPKRTPTNIGLGRAAVNVAL